MPALDSLPEELQTHICSFYYHHELTVLMRVNNSLRCLIEPMLYSQVELHSQGYHEHYRYLSEVDIIPDERRNYCCEDPPDCEYCHDSDATLRASFFMKLFEDSDESDCHPRARREALAEHVQFLCLHFYVDEIIVDPLGIFACFQNLGHLELEMDWPTNETWDTAVRTFMAKSRAPLDNLRTLRLCRYVPKEFVQYLCRGTTEITDLELALLDRPIDRDDDASDLENFEHPDYTPRALAALSGAVDITKQFPCLTRLRLCRPIELRNEGLQGDLVSTVSDTAILKEWATLIRATRGTLEHLILDQHDFAEGTEPDSDSSSDRDYPVDHAYGPSYDRFVEHALPALLEDVPGAEWPCLKSVHLHGFDVPPQDDLDIGQPQRLLGVIGLRFEPLGVDVRSDLGRWILYAHSDGVVRLGGSRWDSEDD
ncbi:hypothetical protein MSAN_00346000 [Mycena sanguinolenta]|uniref:Uncharacterized protein n=1 Tax=Mycena sanguinolenta TaxID=230812 RepID=A0A8H6ZC86_9AGAR|nr:hypothetical protein MSAN_00346000 [Mycena sanguinolenta]